MRSRRLAEHKERPLIRIGATMSIRHVANALFAEEVARARAMTAADRLLAGPRLFERACRLMRAGIRHRHPELHEDAVQALLVAMLESAEALDRR
jgi:hypothetical protein